jgi:hypothetical protein
LERLVVALEKFEDLQKTKPFAQIDITVGADKLQCRRLYFICAIKPYCLPIYELTHHFHMDLVQVFSFPT